MHHPVHVGGAHQERMDHGFPGGIKTAVQALGAEFVHQEADGAAMHAIDRLAGTHVLMQRLQHQSVAADRDHDVGIVRLAIAVEIDQLGQRLLGLRAGARDKGDAIISLGAGHGMTGSLWR